jgi:hypothetical protein
MHPGSVSMMTSSVFPFSESSASDKEVCFESGRTVASRRRVNRRVFEYLQNFCEPIPAWELVRRKLQFLDDAVLSGME